MDTEKYKQQLVALERQLLGREQAAEPGTGGEPGDLVDQSMATDLREEAFRLLESDSTSLTEVQQALRRIEAGTFGLCEVDGAPIETSRLDAVPWARFCLAHQQQREPETRPATI